MKNIKKEKGITLIALVITIIVLLILAGVAISMLSGENGILTRASEASEQTKKISTEEKIKLAATDAMIYSKDYTTIESEDKLNEALARQGVTGATVTQVEGGYTVKVGTEEYKVYSNGSVKAKSIVTDITATNYGDVITNYEANGVNDWKVFLNDGNNVWIIASYYVELDSETAKKAGMTVSGYDAYWKSSNDIPENREIYNTWNCAKVLSNTENWTKYVNTKYANKAIGAPTIEMFAESYNAKYPNETIEYKLETTDSNKGYKLKFNSGSRYGYALVQKLVKDELYFIDSDVNPVPYGWWLASPSADDRKEGLLCVCCYDITCVGLLRWNYGDVGIRPMVCLRSDVQVEKTTSGETTTWTIN